MWQQGQEVVYGPERWRLLSLKREAALKLMEVLSRLSPYVYGSVARGDVRPESDIDVVVLGAAAPFMVEVALESAGLRVFSKEIVQATPNYVPKAYLYLDPEGLTTVSFPLGRAGPRELEFYRWGGMLDVEGVRAGNRVPGVNKELKLIVPTQRGHVEYPVVGHEAEVARVLGVSIGIVEERVRVLSRRREVGRTGTFIKLEVPPDEPLEEAVRDLARRNEFFRRAVGL